MIGILPLSEILFSTVILVTEFLPASLGQWCSTLVNIDNTWRANNPEDSEAPLTVTQFCVVPENLHFQ